MTILLIISVIFDFPRNRDTMLVMTCYHACGLMHFHARLTFKLQVSESLTLILLSFVLPRKTKSLVEQKTFKKKN